MSSHASLYIGPFVECKVTRTTVERTLDKICVNDVCPRFERHTYDNNKFCAECGHPVGHRKIQEEGDSVDRYDMTVKLREKLASVAVSTGMHHYVPNVYVKGMERQMRLHPEEREFAHVLDPGTFIDECHAFTKQFCACMDMLEQAYGKENVRVRWGIINTIG
jgi:hypothetical protein